MNIGEVNWRPDGYTRRYIADHPELQRPSTMSTFNLAVATTFCMTAENPYSEELCRRAGMSKYYNTAASDEERKMIVCKAAYSLGLRMG